MGADINWLQIITIIIATSGLVFTIAYSVAPIKESIKNVKERCNRLEHRCDQSDSKIEQLTDKFAEFRTSTVASLAKLGRNNISATNSPPDLTDKGRKIVKASKLDQFIAERQEQYFVELDQAIGPSELYHACLTIALREFEAKNDTVRPIKDYFYNEDLAVFDLYQAFALQLRNIYQASKKTSKVA